MTKPKAGGASAPAKRPRPTGGGSFIRDPKSGELSRTSPAPVSAEEAAPADETSATGDAGASQEG